MDGRVIIAAANVNPASDGKSFDIYPAHDKSLPTFTVRTLHLSCQSDMYRGRDCKYGGIVIYGRKGEGDWRTANGTHCKSGYVVITQTDTKEFKELQRKWSNEPGQVHGVIYRKVFGESCRGNNVVGEGFGIIGDDFRTGSGAFNPVNDDYHDHNWSMHHVSESYIKALVKIWKDAGPRFRDCQNYSVEELGK